MRVLRSSYWLQATDGKYRLSRKQALMVGGPKQQLPYQQAGYIARYPSPLPHATHRLHAKYRPSCPQSQVLRARAAWHLDRMGFGMCCTTCSCALFSVKVCAEPFGTCCVGVPR